MNDRLLMILIDVRDGKKVREIVQTIGKSQQIAQRGLNKLVEMGLAEREYYPGKKRVKRYLITDDGKEAIKFTEVTNDSTTLYDRGNGDTASNGDVSPAETIPDGNRGTGANEDRRRPVAVYI